MTKLNGALANVAKAVNAMGLNKPGGPQAGLTQLQQNADRLAGGSQQVAGGVDQLVDQIKLVASGLDEASAFLLTMKDERRGPVMAGFNIPAEVLGLPDFQKAAKAFISPDGHSVRYLVQTKLNPFSSEAMDQVNEISDTARGAQPNTTLADATISMGGFPAALRDTRDYYQHDIRFIIAATLIVVLLTLMVLLRAIVAPLVSRRFRGDFVLRGDRHRRAVRSNSSSASSCIGACPRWPSWCWSRWAPTTTCSSCRECGTSLRTACATASSAP